MNRENFVKDALGKKASIAELCREYGISRPTGYTWLRRFENGENFSDKSHQTFKTAANKTPEIIEKKIIEARQAEPAIGATKIKRMLENKGETDIPCHSTINAILKRNNLITPQASENASHYKRYEMSAPNIMWQCDFKGHYELKNGERCHPLSVIDDHSRFCVCADAKENEQLPGTLLSLERTFEEFGKPKILLCDNGNPWGNSSSLGYTQFEVHLMEHGILTVHIRPLHPQSQGKIEKFNKSFKNERLKFYTPIDLNDAQAQRLEYQKFYNNERPHFALKLDLPAQHYEKSRRKFCREVSEWQYDTGFDARHVRHDGYVRYASQWHYLSEAFRGKTVAVRTSQDRENAVDICFREFRIGIIDLGERAIISRKARRLCDLNESVTVFA
jgi:transposase InsO family protein